MARIKTKWLTPFFADVIVLTLTVSGCNQQHARENTQQAQQTQMSPTRPQLSATEEFNLRSKCAEIGDKMEHEYYGLVGAALTSEMMAHYNTETNRCYVQFMAAKNFSYNYPSTPTNYRTIAVYDGQTKERLVYAEQNGDKSYGNIWGGRTFDERYTTFEKAQAEIVRLMGEEGSR